jgi:hypothetical protein
MRSRLVSPCAALFALLTLFAPLTPAQAGFLSGKLTKAATRTQVAGGQQTGAVHQSPRTGKWRRNVLRSALFGTTLATILTVSNSAGAAHPSGQQAQRSTAREGLPGWVLPVGLVTGVGVFAWWKARGARQATHSAAPPYEVTSRRSSLHRTPSYTGSRVGVFATTHETGSGSGSAGRGSGSGSNSTAEETTEAGVPLDALLRTGLLGTDLQERYLEEQGLGSGGSGQEVIEDSGSNSASGGLPELFTGSGSGGGDRETYTVETGSGGGNDNIDFGGGNDNIDFGGGTYGE